MRKLVLMTAIVLMSASAHAQTIDVGSILSANGISLGNAGGQQMGGMGQGGSNMQAMQSGAGGQGAAAQGQSQQAQSPQSQSRQRQSARRGRQGQPHESAQETRARNIAAKYGISW
jgi:hypothetical protein